MACCRRQRRRQSKTIPKVAHKNARCTVNFDLLVIAGGGIGSTEDQGCTQAGGCRHAAGVDFAEGELYPEIRSRGIGPWTATKVRSVDPDRPKERASE